MLEVSTNKLNYTNKYRKKEGKTTRKNGSIERLCMQFTPVAVNTGALDP